MVIIKQYPKKKLKDVLNKNEKEAIQDQKYKNALINLVRLLILFHTQNLNN